MKDTVKRTDRQRKSARYASLALDLRRSSRQRAKLAASRPDKAAATVSPLASQQDNPMGFLPGRLVIGGTAQLAAAAGVIAALVAEALVAGDGAGASVNRHPRATHKHSYDPAATTCHVVSCS